MLDAASTLFVRYGYDKTTMNDIASAAGVAKSTIYLRWKKKEDLFEALVWRESRRYMKAWMARVEADPKGGTYGAWMRHALALFYSNDFLKVLYKRDRRLLGSMLQAKGTQSLYLQRQVMFQQFFQAMQEANAVRKDIDAPTLTYLLNSLQYGLIQMSDIIPDDHTPPMDDVLSLMVDMIEATVTPDGGGDSEAGKAVIRQFMTQIRATLDSLEGNPWRGMKAACS